MYQFFVSVSLRSIIHSYGREFSWQESMLYEYVSVSLRSIIHSYSHGKDCVCRICTACFRLLTEYHSFLWFLDGMMGFLVRLKFPSPYGVSFILIERCDTIWIIWRKCVSVSLRSIIHSYYEYINANDDSNEVSFRLLTEYHSFLWTKQGCFKSERSKHFCFRLLTEYHSFLFNTSYLVL